MPAIVTSPRSKAHVNTLRIVKVNGSSLWELRDRQGDLVVPDIESRELAEQLRVVLGAGEQATKEFFDRLLPVREEKK